MPQGAGERMGGTSKTKKRKRKGPKHGGDRLTKMSKANRYGN